MTATLRQLEAFVTVSQTGSFTAAAELMHVSQPALTAMIKKLEEQLHVTLFERTARGASVTTAGRELLPTVDRLVSELNETLANVLRGTSPRGGIVTIACIPSFAALHLPPLIARFNAVHPAIRVVVRDAITENRVVVDMLRAREIDLGIASPLDTAPELQFARLIDDELVAVLPQRYRPDHPTHITWRELARVPLIGLANHSVVRQLTYKTFARIGISKRPAAEVSLIATAVGMARAGLGATIVPSTASKISLLTGLKVYSIVEPVVRRQLGLSYRSMAELSPAAKAFLKFSLSTRTAAAADL